MGTVTPHFQLQKYVDGDNFDYDRYNASMDILDDEIFQRFRRVTDYGAVGDGITDDTVAIQTAINEGGTPFLPVGTYKVKTLSLPTNITLWGEGKNAIVKSTAGFTVFKNSDVVLGNKDIRLYNFKIDYTPSYATHKAVELITNDALDGTLKNCRLDHVEIVGAGGVSNPATTVDAVLIGSLANSSPADANGVKTKLNENNHVMFCTITGANGVGARLKNCARSSSRFNEIHTCSYGLWLQTNSYRCVIAGNIITNTYNISISVESSCHTSSIFDNNIDTTSDNWGINVEQTCVNVKIKGNTCLNCKGAGIRVTSCTGLIEVSENTCSKCGLGQVGAGISITGIGGDLTNTVVRCTLNTCVGNGRSGILCDTLLRGNVVGNTCVDNNDGAGAYDGITLTLCSGLQVSGNECTDTRAVKLQKYGIAERGASDYNNIVANQTRGNLVAAVLIAGANSVNANNMP